MKGWKSEGTVGVVNDVPKVLWKCEAPLCGALIGVVEGRDDRRREHDREFHLLRAVRGGPNGGYTLHLDGKEIGYCYDRVQHYNLRRATTSHQWTMSAAGEVVRSPWLEKFGRSMNHFVGHLDGAKAWGIGKNPQRWYYPEETR